MIRNTMALSVAVLAVCLGGCGGKGTYPVQGQVVYHDGTPATDLEGYMVSMDLPDEKVGASGVVQPDGSFRVGTFADDDGALPGKYRVALTPPEAPVDRPTPKPKIAAKYGALASSGLEVEVKPESNNVTLQVKRL